MVAGAAASCGVLNIQNQESAENDRVAPLMICVRSSFDSGAACVRLAGMRSEFLVCLSGALQKFYGARSRLCLPTHFFEWSSINVVANTTRGHSILKHSAKADTKSFGRVLGRRTQTAPLSKLERTQIIKGATQSFSANS